MNEWAKVSLLHLVLYHLPWRERRSAAVQEMVSTSEYRNCRRQKTQKKVESQAQRFTLAILGLRRRTQENHELKDSLADSRTHHQEYSKTAFLHSERMWALAWDAHQNLLCKMDPEGAL